MKEKQKNIKIAIIGLGYVGLPLAIEFSKYYYTIGYDNNKNRINDLAKGVDVTLEIEKETIESSKLKYSYKLEDIEDCNIYIVTVPTPVDKNNKPDMNFLKSACEAIGAQLKKDDIVVFESTVYPGATEEFCVPILEKKSNLVYNNDFFCGYSPERINPGDKKHTLQTIVKIVSGSNKNTSSFLCELYSNIVPAGIHKASSIRIAEAAKVIENIQRDVNIALINELSMLFHKMDIETNEVLEAANTKWNFIDFKPGLVGGHCIGVDPYYLTHKAQELGYIPEIILAGRRINDSMGKYISDITVNKMLENEINISDSLICVLGVTFKENCPDTRNTKAFDIIHNLKNLHCNLIVSDPYADMNEVKLKTNIEPIKLDQISKCNAVIIAVGHELYKNISIENWKKILDKDGIIIDVKSIYNKNYFDGTGIAHWRL